MNKTTFIHVHEVLVLGQTYYRYKSSETEFQCTG